MSGFRIVIDDLYTYTGGIPVGCKGHLYRVEGFPLAVPSYQEQILVRALSGPDKDKLFVCSPANFSTRYEPIPVPKLADRPAGYESESWRNGS